MSPSSSTSAAPQCVSSNPFQRKWSREEAWGDAAISVASWNVLAQNCVRSGDAFPYTHRPLLKWKRRKCDLIAFIKNILPNGDLPDILCLQEVDNFNNFWFDQLRMLGYTEIQYKPRTVKRSLKKDGSLIAFRNNRFALVDKDTHHLEFNYLNNIEELVHIVAKSRDDAASPPPPESPSEFAKLQSAETAKKRAKAPYLVRDCVAAVCVFKSNTNTNVIDTDDDNSNQGEHLHKDDRRKNNNDSDVYVVASAHLFWDPWCTDIKILQAVHLLKHINQVCEKHNNNVRAVILSGDLNSMPDSAVFSILTTGKLDKNHKDCVFVSDELFQYINNILENDCTKVPFLHSSYQFPDLEENNGTDDQLISTLTHKFHGALDHIFWRSLHTTNNNIDNDAVVSRLELPALKDCKRAGIRAFPAEQCPSDHLPVVSVFDFDA